MIGKNADRSNVMPVSCAAVGCTQRFQKGSGVGFSRFPVESSKKMRWIVAMRRDKWVPGDYSYICGKHFISGRPSKNPKDPDYVPSIFFFSPVASSDQQRQKQSRSDRQKSRAERRKSLELHRASVLAGEMLLLEHSYSKSANVSGDSGESETVGKHNHILYYNLYI